jgi:hypothetical protein
MVTDGRKEKTKVIRAFREYANVNDTAVTTGYWVLYI